ncbi:hypothetical protein J4436_02500 [Candidatus Woesearchaeota archaeon]|nr:hypothetical protein [Candidatus Woesearchaeota archaeon]
MKNLRLAAYYYLVCEPLFGRRLDLQLVLNVCKNIINCPEEVEDYFLKRMNLRGLRGLENNPILESILSGGPIDVRSLLIKLTKGMDLLFTDSYWFNLDGTLRESLPYYSKQQTHADNSGQRTLPSLDHYDLK